MSADTSRQARWAAIRDGSASEHDWRNWCALCESERILDHQKHTPDPVDEWGAENDAAEYRKALRFAWTLGGATLIFTLALGAAVLHGALST